MAQDNGNRTGKTSLVGADFDGCNLVNLKASGADVSHANFDNTVLNYVEFDGANMSGASLHGASFDSVNFDGAIMYGVQVDAQAFYQGVESGAISIEGAVGVELDHEHGMAVFESVPEREALRAQGIGSVCKAHEEAAAVHFSEVDTKAMAADVVAGLGNEVVQAMGLETENLAIGPPGEELQEAAREAAFAEFTEINITAAELEAAGVQDARNVAQAAVQEGLER